MNKKKTTGLLLSILGVISLILITAGVTYAFFTYAREGETPNTISTGTIEFEYDELTEQEGNKITITDALPMDDDTGMALSDQGQKFDFKIKSKITGSTTISYEITVRKDNESTLSDDMVKIYLEPKATDSVTSQAQEVNSTIDGGVVKTFKELTATSKVGTSSSNIVEKTIFTGVVPANTANYERNFTLRMWISGDSTTTGTTSDNSIDYSPFEFVKRTAVGEDGEALDADELIASEDFITSTTYYAMDDAGRANYERIAYVNMTDRTFYSVSQAVTKGWIDETTRVQKDGVSIEDGFTQSEQFYAINGQSFKIKVNVYANAPVVTP